MAPATAKAMPKALAIVEALLRKHPTKSKKDIIGTHVGEWYEDLSKKESENVYQMAWLAYFMKANGLAQHLSSKKPKDPVARAPRTGRFSALGKTSQSHLFRGVMTAAKAGSMLQHLDIFDRTP
ncbi:hypothetical protein BH24ACI5_BH24ACI5_26770 [soil metagenome]